MALSASVAPPDLRVERARGRLVERAAGEAERRGADRGAEDVERRHRLGEAAAALAEQGGGGQAHVGEFERGERVRRDHPDALAVVEPRRAGIDDEGGDALGARRLAGAGEEDVEIGDAAVGDIGLGAVDDDSRRRSARGAGLHRGDVRAGGRLGQREGGDLLALGDRRKIRLFLRFGAEQADRARSEPLHGEGEIGEAAMARQRLADQRERADVERLVDAAISRRHAIAQPAAGAEPARPGARHSASTSSPCGAASSASHQASSSSANSLWESSKNGQSRKLRSAISRPRTRASASPQRPRRRGGSRWSPCRSPGPAPPSRSRSRGSPPIRC